MIVALDVETTKSPNMFPWQKLSSLVSVCIVSRAKRWTWIFNHDQRPPSSSDKEQIKEIKEVLSAASVVVGHNIKFDLLWLRDIGIDVDSLNVYCTQVAEYLISHQAVDRDLALNDLCNQYQIPLKHDKVKLYWDAGVDTPQIPLDILVPYGEQDTLNALSLFYLQHPKLIEKGLYTLFQLEMEALKIFADMEYNGMKIDVDLLAKYSEDYRIKINTLEMELLDILGIDNINSSEQLSAGLYGGVFKRVRAETYIREYKTREPKECVRYIEEPIILPGIFDPKKFKLKELSKPGVYSVAVPVLQSLTASNKLQKRVLDLLYEHSRLSQMKSTYFDSLPQHADENGIVHASLNQTVTKTGRMSCSRPNLQNQPRGNTGPVKECFISRYET